jgi:hypothetical protein
MTAIRRWAVVAVGLQLLAPLPTSGQIAERDAAVYVAAIGDMLRPPRGAIISTLSTRPELLTFAGGWFGRADVDSAVASAFVRANASRVPVSPFEIDGIELRFIADSSLTELSHSAKDAAAFWDEFRRRYPDAHGILSLTGIGYSQNGDHAIVAVNYGCGPLCGGGRIVALRKVDDAWIVSGPITLWRF